MSLLHPDVLNSLRHPSMVPNPHQRPADEQGIPDYSSAPPTPQAPPGYFRETGLSVEKFMWFRGRDEKEKKHREAQRYGTSPATELAEVLAYRLTPDSPEEKTYVGVNRLFEKGFFLDPTLDIANKDHQKFLAVGLTIFEPGKIPTDFSFEDRALALHILNAYQDVYKSDKSAHPSEAPKDSLIDKRTLELFKTATGVNGRLGAIVQAVESWQAIGELTGIISKTDPIPITKSQFQRIFGNNYPPENIPALLNSGLTLETGLQQELTTKSIGYLQTQIAARPVNPPVEQPMPQLDPQDKAAVCSDLAHFLETAKVLEVAIPDEVQLEIAQRYEQALPTDQELAEHSKEVDTQLEKFQEELNTTRQVEIYRVARQVAQDLGYAVHGWCQRTKNVKDRKERLGQAKGDFLSFVDALGIKEISGYQNMSLRGIQDLIEHQIITAQAKGIDVLKAVGTAYENDVRMTRNAILRCRQLNGMLSGPHDDLKRLGEMIISHEKTVEKRFEKIAKGLRLINAMYDGIKIAGAITSVVPGGQVLGAALMAAGELGSQATGLVEGYNNRGWDAQYGWAMNRLSSITRAEEMLFGVNANLQNWNQVLLGRKRDQEEFLLKNPQLFRPQAYLRMLRDIVIDARKNLENIDSQTNQTRAKETEYLQEIDRITPESGKSEQKMISAQKKARRDLNKKNIKELNRHTKAYSQFRTRLATLTAERLNNFQMGDVLSFQREEELKNLKTLEARLAQYEKIAEMPDHHKKGAENMSTEELLRSSENWLAKLEKEYSLANQEWKDSRSQALQSAADQANYRKTVVAEQGRELNRQEIRQFVAERKRKNLQIDEANERYRASFQSLVDEKIFQVQIRRQQDIGLYRSHSSADHPNLIPSLSKVSNNRIASLRHLVFTQQTLVRTIQEKELKLRREIAFLKQYEGLDPLAAKPTPEQISGHNQLGELKDELDARKAFRLEQEKVCRELDAAIGQEETYRDVHLWEAIDLLPLNQRIPCAQKCRDNLFASYDASYAQKKLDLELINKLEKEDQQKLNDFHHPNSNVSLLEQNESPHRRQLNEQIDRARIKRYVTLSEMQTIAKAKLQETVKYCSLSHRVDVERWEQADNEGRKSLLPAMQLSSNERHKLLTTAQEEASHSKELFQAAADEANTIFYAAEMRLRDDSSADKLEIQEAIDDARLKYVGLRKSRQDAAQAEAHLREKIAQNENALKRSYVEGYIAEMQSTLRWLQMKQRDSADQALYDELRHLVQAFEQDNALTHLGNCIEVFGWCAEIMRKTPFSTKERESYARLVFYCRTLSSVATLGVDIWGFHKLVQTRWSKNAGSSLSVIPNMDWVKLLIETGLAFGSASPADMALLLINSLKAAGMVVQSLKLWKDERHLIGPNLFERVDGLGRQMENFVERMDAHFLTMEKHLEAQMVFLQSHQDQLTDELRADLKSLSHKIQVLSKLREDQIKQLVGKVEAGNFSTQQTLVTQEVAKFKASCSNAQSWLRDPERAKALWLSKYLESVKHFLSRAVDPDITGRNKPGTVDLSKIAASPHDYVGFLGNFVGLIVPSVPLFNAVAASLAQVGRAALQRGLPIEDKKDIRDKVVLALSSANRITIFTDLASTFIDKAAEALCNLSKYYSAVLQKAEDKRAEALSSILEQSIKGSQNTFLILTNEKSQRFALSTVLHEASFGPVFQDRLRDHLKAWGGQSHALQNIGLPAVLLGVSIASPPLALAYGGLVVALRLPEIGRFIYSSTDSLGSREQEISRLMSTLRLGSEILPSEFNDKEDNLSIDFYSDETNSLEICESRLTYRCQSLCIKTHSDSRGISRNDRRKGLSSAPIVSATVRLFFSEGYPRVWKFEPDGLIQESDVKRIHKIGLSRIQGDHYKDSAAYIQRVKELFEAVEELVSKREKTPESNPLSAIAKTSTFIPPAARGMVPLALPTALIERLTGQLREDLSFLHFVKCGTLVPYYEFKKNEFKKELALSIVFRHRNNEGIEQDFCRFRDVLAIDRRTQGALEGVCSDANSPQTPVQASRMLLYIMYGGLVGLGMPGHESYSLQNSKGVAPVDLPFEGFYQKLIKDTQRGIHFHTGEFKTESSPEGWFTDIEMEPCYEGDLIMDAALEENFPELVEEMHKNPQFQAYEESYYQAMAHLAFTHSLKTNVLNGIDNEQIIEDAPALEDLGSLFADCGFPSPDATFESCRKMKTADPDARGLLGKLKSAYNLTVHHQTFIDNSNDLLFLLNSLNTEPTLSPEKSVPKVQQETGRSISSREPSYRTGMSVDVSAHQWYSQQRRDGVGEKRNQAKAAADAVKFKLKEGKQFSVDRQFYYIAVTTPDGACGLHALVGKKIDGRYTYPDSRKEFGLKLSHKIEEQFIRQLWRGWMLVSLKDYIGIRSYPYTEFVFGKIPNSIQTLQVALAELDREKDKLQKDQEALFDQLPQLDEFKDSKDLDREKRNNKIRENLNQIIEKQKGNDFGKALANNLASLAGVQSRREALLENVIDKKEAWEAYKEAIADSGYYLSTQELGLAAHLFEKRVVVYAESPLNPGKAELCFKAGNSDHPEIVIFHRGLHYSRCEEIVPPAE